MRHEEFLTDPAPPPFPPPTHALLDLFTSFSFTRHTHTHSHAIIAEEGE